ARQRPQAGPAAAGRDDDVEHRSIIAKAGGTVGSSGGAAGPTTGGRGPPAGQPSAARRQAFRCTSALDAQVNSLARSSPALASACRRGSSSSRLARSTAICAGSSLVYATASPPTSGTDSRGVVSTGVPQAKIGRAHV